MFGIGMPELLVILVIALLVVGPKRLPDIAKALGKGLSELRKVTEDATDTIKESLRAEELNKETEDRHPPVPPDERSEKQAAKPGAPGTDGRPPQE